MPEYLDSPPGIHPMEFVETPVACVAYRDAEHDGMHHVDDPVLGGGIVAEQNVCSRGSLHECASGTRGRLFTPDREKAMTHRRCPGRAMLDGPFPKQYLSGPFNIGDDQVAVDAAGLYEDRLVEQSSRHDANMAPQSHSPICSFNRVDVLVYSP